MNEIIKGLFVLIGVLVPAYLLHKREIAKHKLEISKLNLEKKQDKLKLDFFNRAMDLSRINPIINAVNRLFKETVADRFLILIAINGKTDFNIVSVIFEQHNDNKHPVNAIGTYRNIEVDNAYRNMLKLSEINGAYDIDVSKMNDCILKSFYEYEGVKHSKVRFLDRQKIDNDNDFVIYSSLATHKNKSYNKIEEAIIKTVYESTIIPNIKKVVE